MVASLADERYISLTTFKRDGTPVSTPVWGASSALRGEASDQSRSQQAP
jgi:hypothetical protein